MNDPFAQIQSLIAAAIAPCILRSIRIEYFIGSGPVGTNSAEFTPDTFHLLSGLSRGDLDNGLHNNLLWVYTGPQIGGSDGGPDSTHVYGVMDAR